MITGSRRVVVLAVAIATLVCARCADVRETNDDPQATVRDSAGVEIIANAQDDTVLSAEPVLRVGVVDGDPSLQFSRIRSIAVHTSGSVWVVDSHETIRRFDSDGKFSGAVGGKGRGPGEAEGYAHAWVASDNLLAWGYPSIIQQFSLDGRFLGSRLGITEDGRLVTPIGYANDQWYFAIQDYGSGAQPVARMTVHVASARALTAVPDTIHSFAGDMVRSAGGGEFARASYFHGNPSYAVDGEGRLFISDTLAYRVSVYDRTGRIVRIVERAVPPQPYDPAWRAEIEHAVTVAMSRDGRNPVTPAARDRLVSSIIPSSPPTHLPFIQRVLVSTTGDLWVERADRHPRPELRAVAHAFGYIRHAWRPEWQARQVFDVFDPSGKYRCTVELPANYEAMAVTRNRVYGVEYDEMGVEYVVVRQLSSIE